MNQATQLDDLNSFSSKTLIRAKVKETFTELSATIFEYVDEVGTLDAKKFEAMSSFHSQFYVEYFSQLKDFFESNSITITGKRPPRDMYFSYNNKTYMLTQQGITAKSPMTISTIDAAAVPLKSVFNDVDKACITIRFS
ncbi:MAG: hypothetical protein RR595_13035 [Lysinibacillus sp.]